MNDNTGRDAPQLKLRLDGELKAWLKSQAALNRRSLTSEIVVRLEQSRKQQEASGTPA